MDDLRERSLVRLAKKCEDAASGLHGFRDQLPHFASSITGSIGRLFDISSRLHEIDHAQGDQRYASSFYLIQNDLAVLRPTLDGTLDAIFEMFGSTRDRSYATAWEGFLSRMDRDEGVELFKRLGWYQVFLKAQFEEVTGVPGADPSELRRILVQLTERQEDTVRKARRRSADVSGTGGLLDANVPWLNVEQHRLRRVRTRAGRGCLVGTHRDHRRRRRAPTAATFHPSPLIHLKLCRCRLPLPQARRRHSTQATRRIPVTSCHLNRCWCTGHSGFLTVSTLSPASTVTSSCNWPLSSG